MTSQLRDDQKTPARDLVRRTLNAGVFLLLELPLLLPVIVGWALMTLFIRVRALTRGRRAGPDERIL